MTNQKMYDLLPEEIELVADYLSKIQIFLQKPLDEKCLQLAGDSYSGFRPAGLEVSDDSVYILNTESFNYRPRDLTYLQKDPLSDAVYELFLKKIKLFFQEIGLSVSLETGLSWLQVNHFFNLNQEITKTNLNDGGHVDHSTITAIITNTPGLEILSDSIWKPLHTGLNAIFIMVQDYTKLLYDEKIEPVVHRVNIPSGIEDRLSLVMFGTSDCEIDSPQFPLMEMSHARQMIQTSQHEFKLPNLF